MAPDLFECSQLSPSPVPATRCYPLEPCGLGTPYLESLPSYLNRLAVAHSLPVAILLSREICPLLGNGQFVAGAGSLYLASLSRRLLAGDLPARFCDALTRLTGVQSLEPLSHVHSNRVIGWIRWFRNRSAWCPGCISEWAKADLPQYAPLLWAIKSVVCCPVHKVRLVEACSCGHQFWHLASRAWVSDCHACEQPLAAIPVEPCTEADVVVANLVGEFIVWSSTLVTMPDPAILAGNVETAARLHGKLVLEHALGLTKHTLRTTPGVARHPTRMLTLGLLLRLSAAVGVAPSRLVTVALSDAELAKLVPVCGSLLVADRREAAIPDDEVRRLLKQALVTSDLPVSPDSIAKRNSMSNKTLYRKFRAEVDALVQARRDFRHRQAVARLELEHALIREAIKHAESVGEAFTIAGALRFLGGRWTFSTDRFRFLLRQMGLR